MNNWMAFFGQQLNIKRTYLPRITTNPRYLISKNQQLLNFISNDYLGLITNASIKQTAIETIATYGIGSSGAPSLSGYTEEHLKLKNNLAKWLNYEDCLLFNSGYQMNVGIYSQLSNKNTIIWLDKRCHASHIDGILLSKSKFNTFLEKDIEKVEQQIQAMPDKLHLVISEGSFSMDGTCSYLKTLTNIKRTNINNVLLIIDDAHGIGSLGINGYGTFEQIGLNHNIIDLFIGTLGKSFASHGGFLCSSKKIISYLQQKTRSQIFSTNLPPLLAATSNQALQIISSENGYLLRKKLQNNIIYFKQLCDKYNLIVHNKTINHSPIQLIISLNNELVSHIYQYLYQTNILVAKIFYPTVAKDTPRIRISINAAHTYTDLERLVKTLAKGIQVHHG